jgi:hypothetical protein
VQPTIGSTASTTTFQGQTLPAAQFGTPDASGNTSVSKPGFVVTPDGGGYYYLMGDGTEYKRPDGSYVRYDQATKRYVPVVAAPTIISSMAQFYKLPSNVQEMILQGKPTGYVLNNRGIDTHVASQMIEQERQRIAKERGIDPAKVPQQLLDMFANQFFAGLEPGRIYPGGWVSSMFAPYNGPTGTMMTRDQFLALPPDQQRSLLDGFAGTDPSQDPLRQYRASTGQYTPGSTNFSAQDGPVGGMPTGLGTLVQPTPDVRQFNYGQYMTQADYQRLYPEYFQPQPVYMPPPQPPPPPQSNAGGNSADHGQPPRPARAGMKWVWVPA